MRHVLEWKYPMARSGKEMGGYALMVAMLTYLFIACYQPFGTYNYSNPYKYALLAPYAAIAFLIFLGGDMAVARLFRQWKWKNEIAKITVLLFVCSFFNYLYSIWFINDAGFSVRALYYMVLFTYALGVPVCFLYFFVRYALLRPVAPALARNESDAYRKVAGSELAIVPDSGDLPFSIAPADFLFAKSEGNYSLLYYRDGQAVHKKLVRLSLKKLEGQICDGPIWRCHRSYIVNMEMAIDKKGNAQGYKISMRHIEEPVPVSRGYADELVRMWAKR